MTDHAMDEPTVPVGWPFPWWGLLAGGLFLGAMLTPLGPLMGIIAGFGVAVLAIPFIATGTLIGGDRAVPLCVLIGLSGFVVVCIGVSVRGILGAPDHKTRALLMNKLALFILLIVGLGVSLHALEAAWRY